MRPDKRHAASFLATASLMACAWTASSAAFGASPSSGPLAKLAIWQGRWREVVVTRDTPYSRASSVPAHVTCSWTPDHGYMLCEYHRDQGDPRELLAADHLSIFTYDNAKEAYKHLGVSKNYNTLEEMARIDGKVWHYTYELPTSDGKTLDLRDSYEFVNPKERITRIEVSSDHGKHWILISESMGHKVS